MTQSTMRRLEKWAGIPTCAVLTLVRTLTSRKHRPNRPQKILLLKLIEQGASVLAYSAIETAIRKVGKQNVYFWVFEENRAIVSLLGLIPEENLLILSHKSLGAFVRTLISNLWRIRRAKIDTVIDMEFYSRASAILSYLSGARTRVGLHRFTHEAPYRGNLFTHRVLYNPFLHTSKAYLHLVLSAFEENPSQPAGKIPVAELKVENPKFVPTPTEIARVESLIRHELGPEANGAGRWLFLLNPNASDLLPIRKWPTENFLTLAKRILNEFEDSYVLLTGAPSERQVVEGIAALISHPRCASVAGKTSLRELFALYAVSDILVTNDSGPGHFASMTPVDSIVLFGPETPALFGPQGESSHAVWNQLGCSPCVSPTNHRLSPCDDAVCMKSITVAQVWSIMESKLKSRQRKAEPYFIDLSLPEYSIKPNPTQPVLQ